MDSVLDRLRSDVLTAIARRKDRECSHPGGNPASPSIFLTSTVNAGKSTLLNALAGQFVCPVGNLPSGKVMRAVASKEMNDGRIGVYGRRAVPCAGPEDIRTAVPGDDGLVWVNSYFYGAMRGMCQIWYDSPGSNTASGLVTEKALRQLQYDLIVYLLNAEQLATHDDREHLKYVASLSGYAPVLFVLNKVDRLNPEEDGSVSSMIRRMDKDLRSLGFDCPLICPLSAKAAYLARMRSTRTRQEEKDFLYYADMLAANSLALWYRRSFPYLLIAKGTSVETGLLDDCGFAGFESVLNYIL